MIGAVLLLAATYYVAPNGSDANAGTLVSPWQTVGKAAQTMVAGDTVFIRTGTYREQLVPANSGSSGAFVTYAAYPGETPTIDGTNLQLERRSGLIAIVNKNFIRIEGLHVTRSGPHNTDAGIFVSGSSDIIIANNFTYDTRSSGIAVWSSRNVTVTGNDVRLACHYNGYDECITVAATDTFEVSGNLVHQGSLDPVGGEGIGVKQGSSHGFVHGNEIRELVVDPAIYIDAWDAHTFDIRVSGNRIHDNAMAGIALASELGGLLENIAVTNNLVYNCGNHGLVLGGWGQAPVQPLRDVRIVNNTIYNCGAATGAGGISLDNDDAQSIVIRNNIVSRNFAFQIAARANIPDLIVDHNLIDGFRGAAGETLGTEAQQGDARFVDVAAGDLRLRPDSPAINRGSALDAPLSDFAGVARPQGGAFDIGAHEYVVPRRRPVRP